MMIRASDFDFMAWKPEGAARVSLCPEDAEKPRAGRGNKHEVNLYSLVGLVADGWTDADIATMLACPQRIVRRRLNELIAKTGARNRTQLAVWFATGTITVPGEPGE